VRAATRAGRTLEPMLLARGVMTQPLRNLIAVVAVATGLAACGGKSSHPDGGPAGAAGSAGAGRGGGGAGGASGAAGSAGPGRGGGGGSATGVAGTQGAAGMGGAGGGGPGPGGSGAGTGGSAGSGGAPSGTAGSGGPAGGPGGGGPGGGAAGKGGAPGTGGAGGGGGGGGTAGAAGSTGRGGAGGSGAGGTGGSDAKCTAPADCSGGLGGTTGTFCSPAWSCVNYRCTAECMSGRTCLEMPDSDCLVCRTGSGSPVQEGCPSTACAFDPARVGSVSQVTCASSPPPDFSTWHCTGRWAKLPDGTLCTIQTIPTDAIRWSVSCGGCVTVVEIH